MTSYTLWLYVLGAFFFQADSILFYKYYKFHKEKSFYTLLMILCQAMAIRFIVTASTRYYYEANAAIQKSILNSWVWPASCILIVLVGIFIFVEILRRIRKSNVLSSKSSS